MLDRIYLFDTDETYRAVLKNENPGAGSFFNAAWTEKLNAEVTLEFEVDAKHEDSQYVKGSCFAAIPDLDNTYQLFLIRKVDEIKTVNGLIKHAQCESAAVELLDEPVRSYSNSSATPVTVLTYLLSGSRWQLGTVDTFPAQAITLKNTNVLNGIYEMIKVFGGEVRFRVTYTPGSSTITGRYVDFLARRGTDTNRRFEYTRDLVSIRRTSDDSNVKTALIGIGKSETDPETGAESRVDFTNVVWSTASGKPADKPAGQDWIGDDTAKNIFGFKNNDGTRRHRFGYFEDPDETDPAKLLQKAYDALQEVKNPLVQYEMTVVDLERLTGYDHMKVRLGDTVHVVDKEFVPELRVAARVIEITRYLNEPEKTVIKLGNFVPELTDNSDRIREIERRLGDRSGIWDGKIGLGQIIDVYNNEIRSVNGYVYITDADGILVLDKPKDQNPTQAVRIKGGIVGISNTKDGQGNWIFRTAMDGSGIVADVINSGTLQSDRVRGGEFYLGGNVNGEAKDGKLFLVNSANEVVAQLDAASMGFDKLFVNELSGNNVVLKNSKNLTYYVDPVNGNDENDGLTSGTAFKTYAKLASVLPDENNGIITVYLASGATVNENIYLKGIDGQGQLILDFQSGKINGFIKVMSCSHHITLKNGIVSHINQRDPEDTMNYGCIRLRSSEIVVVDSMTLYANDYAYACVYVEAATCTVTNTKMFDATEALIYAVSGGHVNAYNNQGYGATYAYEAALASHIAGYGTCPSSDQQTADAHFKSTTGGYIPNTFGTVTPGTKGTIPTNPSRLIITEVDGHSYDPINGWARQAPTQGTPSPKWFIGGAHKGLWFMDYATIRSTLAGKTIQLVRVKLTRKRSEGYYRDVPLYFYTHNNTSASGPDPVLSNSAGMLAKFKPGETKWVNLPISFGNALRDGTATGIAIYTADPNPGYFAAMETALTLEIHYT